MDDIAAGRLVRLLSDWTPPFPGLCLYYPGRRNPSAGLTAFWRWRARWQNPLPLREEGSGAYFSSSTMVVARPM